MKLQYIRCCVLGLATIVFVTGQCDGEETRNGFAALVFGEDLQGRDLQSGFGDDKPSETVSSIPGVWQPTEVAALPNQAESGFANSPENESLFADRKTSVQAGRLVLPPIAAVTTNTDEIGNGVVPAGFRQGEPMPMMPLPESAADRDPLWQWQLAHWSAANTFSHPLYFEDRMLERHGHQRYPRIQSLASGARFVSQWVALPYLSILDPPMECDYLLGYYRAGSCVPKLRQRPPRKRKAVVGAAVTTAAAAIALP